MFDVSYTMTISQYPHWKRYMLPLNIVHSLLIFNSFNIITFIFVFIFTGKCINMVMILVYLKEE